MLNGKFYTGLTPKMINRNNTSAINRQESHFFWPDDTDTESAVETRVRRRSSLSIPAAERQFIQRRQTSTAASDSDVDTKQMLHKEFAKSSIQFFDNICEEDETAAEQRRKPLLRSGKQEITIKPTATKYEMPNCDNTDMAAIKNKHVYESKVEFFDYADEDRNKRNNERKAKIDMNDKRDVERNTKNSPKLQNKRNVNNYIENPYNNNKQETMENGANDQHILTKPRLRAGIEFKDDVEDIDDNNLRKSRVKSFETKSRYNKYRRDQTPKRILKNTERNGIDYSDYPECRDEELYNEAVDYMAQTMKNARINGRRAPPRKQVTYSEEEEEIPVRNNLKTYNDNDEDNLHYRKDSNHSKYRNAQSASANAGSNRRQHRETFSSDHSDLDQDQYMELKNKNKKNNNNNNNNKHEKSIKLSSETPDSLDELTKKSTTFTVPANNANAKSTEEHYNRAHKHLRSSLCFNDGEIVASDIDSASTPVHQQRRNARNAATRRVSVGLPD